MTVGTKIITAGILILITILSGLWLSKSGRPLNSLIFTIHKLAAVAAVIFLVLAVKSLPKDFDFTFIFILIITLLGLSFTASIITGGFLSFEKTMPGFILTLHKILSVLVPVIIIIYYFLLLKE